MREFVDYRIDSLNPGELDVLSSAVGVRRETVSAVSESPVIVTVHDGVALVRLGVMASVPEETLAPLLKRHAPVRIERFDDGAGVGAFERIRRWCSRSFRSLSGR